MRDRTISNTRNIEQFQLCVIEQFKLCVIEQFT